MMMAFFWGGRGVCYKTALVNKFFFQAANRVSHISGICYPFEISAASHLHTKLSLSNPGIVHTSYIKYTSVSTRFSERAIM